MTRVIGVLVFLLGVCAAASAQTDAHWVQPYPELPAYWELVGHLFGRGSE